MEARAAVLLEEGRRLGRPWLGAILDALDNGLRLNQGVIEYTRHPDCLFRIQIIASCADVVLSDGARVHPGDRLISLHVWNEQFPAFPRADRLWRGRGASTAPSTFHCANWRIFSRSDRTSTT